MEKENRHTHAQLLSNPVSVGVYVRTCSLTKVIQSVGFSLELHRASPPLWQTHAMSLAEALEYVSGLFLVSPYPQSSSVVVIGV